MVVAPQQQMSSSYSSRVDPLSASLTSYEQSRRQISSVVISEELLGERPRDDQVRYVEVPVVQEVVRHVPKREVVEVEKVVPTYQVEWVERTVEVPQIVYVDNPVERVQVQEVVRTIPKKEIREVPREVIRTVPRVEYVQVEKIVQVPGQVIEVPKPYTVVKPTTVRRVNETQVPVVVAQTIRPVICESQEVVDVDVYEYEPEVIPVDVHVAKPVPAHLVALGATEEVHKPVVVPAAQYNTLLRQLNAHLPANEIDMLPFAQEARSDGTTTTPFLAANETPGTAPVVASARLAEPSELKGLNTTNTLGSQQGGVTADALPQVASRDSGGSPYNSQQQLSTYQPPVTLQSSQRLPPVYPINSAPEIGSTVDDMRSVRDQPRSNKAAADYQRRNNSTRISQRSAGLETISHVPRSSGGQRKRRGCQC